MISATLVIFDVDGTLIQSMALEAKCFSEACRECFHIDGIDTNWSSYKNTTDPGVAMEVFERRYGRSPSSDELNSFRAVFVENLRHQIAGGPNLIRETPGAERLLMTLRRDPNFEVSIATGAWREPIALKLAAARLRVEGFSMTSADDAIERERIVSIARSRATSAPSRCISIGDGAWDVAAARNLGLAFLGVGKGDQAARLRAAGAKWIVEDFLDVDPILENFSAFRKNGSWPTHS